MWHNHKNHIGSPCRSVFDFLPNQWKNRKPHRSPKSEKPLYFCQKTEKPDGKKGKTGNRNGQQDRENEVFQCKNRKTDPQNGQNWKTENPNAPLLYLRTNEVFLCFLPFVFLSSFVPTSLFFSFTSPTIFTGPYFEDESVQWKMYQLVTIVIKFKSISKRLLNVQSTPDNSNPR